MSLITQLTPTNLLEEKEKFFRDQTYNPRFTYDEPIPTDTLTKYGVPTLQYRMIAQEILNKAYDGRTEDDLYSMKGKQLTQKEVTDKIKAFLKMHHLDHRFQIVWSESFITRTTITSDTIKLKLPVNFYHEGLIGMLYHEIGTHAVRRFNYEQQPWYRRKKKFGFENYLKTEEGLASLHSLLPHSFKLAFVPASRYLAVEKAQQGSFVDVWNFLGEYIQNPERRWVATLRQKRGMTDTSQPGGFTKDLVYFQGMVDVWRWLKAHDFDITQLYFGKMSTRDVEKAVEMNPSFEPLLPSFFILDKDQYAQDMLEIGVSNFFD